MRLQGLGVVASVALLIAGACLLNVNDKGAGRQKWEIKTSSGQIPTGWEPFAFDSFDCFDCREWERRCRAMDFSCTIFPQVAHFLFLIDLFLRCGLSGQCHF